MHTLSKSNRRKARTARNTFRKWFIEEIESEQSDDDDEWMSDHTAVDSAAFNEAMSEDKEEKDLAGTYRSGAVSPEPTQPKRGGSYADMMLLKEQSRIDEKRAAIKRILAREEEKRRREEESLLFADQEDEKSMPAADGVDERERKHRADLLSTELTLEELEAAERDLIRELGEIAVPEPEYEAQDTLEAEYLEAVQEYSDMWSPEEHQPIVIERKPSKKVKKRKKSLPKHGSRSPYPPKIVPYQNSEATVRRKKVHEFGNIEPWESERTATTPVPVSAGGGIGGDVPSPIIPSVGKWYPGAGHRTPGDDSLSSSEGGDEDVPISAWNDEADFSWGEKKKKARKTKKKTTPVVPRVALLAKTKKVEREGSPQRSSTPTRPLTPLTGRSPRLSQAQLAVREKLEKEKRLEEEREFVPTKRKLKKSEQTAIYERGISARVQKEERLRRISEQMVDHEVGDKFHSISKSKKLVEKEEDKDQDYLLKLYEEGQKAIQKKKTQIKEREEELAQKELEGFTFKPEISERGRNKQLNEDFLERNKSFLEQKQQRIDEALKQRQLEEDQMLTFQPKIGERSASIRATAKPSDAADRLYREGAVFDLHRDEIRRKLEIDLAGTMTFQPAISRASQDLADRPDRREKSIHDRLLEQGKESEKKRLERIQKADVEAKENSQGRLPSRTPKAITDELYNEATTFKENQDKRRMQAEEEAKMNAERTKLSASSAKIAMENREKLVKEAMNAALPDVSKDSVSTAFHMLGVLKAPKISQWPELGTPSKPSKTEGLETRARKLHAKLMEYISKAVESDNGTAAETYQKFTDLTLEHMKRFENREKERRLGRDRAESSPDVLHKLQNVTTLSFDGQTKWLARELYEIYRLSRLSQAASPRLSAKSEAEIKKAYTFAPEITDYAKTVKPRVHEAIESPKYRGTKYVDTQGAETATTLKPKKDNVVGVRAGNRLYDMAMKQKDTHEWISFTSTQKALKDELNGCTFQPEFDASHSQKNRDIVERREKREGSLMEEEDNVDLPAGYGNSVDRMRVGVAMRSIRNQQRDSSVHSGPSDFTTSLSVQRGEETPKSQKGGRSTSALQAVWMKEEARRRADSIGTDPVALSQVEKPLTPTSFTRRLSMSLKEGDELYRKRIAMTKGRSPLAPAAAPVAEVPPAPISEKKKRLKEGPHFDIEIAGVKENGKDVVLTVYKSDDPAELAAEFCYRHSLKDAIFSRLEQMIAAQMQEKFYPKKTKKASKKKKKGLSKKALGSVDLVDIEEPILQSEKGDVDSIPATNGQMTISQLEPEPVARAKPSLKQAPSVDRQRELEAIAVAAARRAEEEEANLKEEAVKDTEARVRPPRGGSTGESSEVLNVAVDDEEIDRMIARVEKG